MFSLIGAGQCPKNSDGLYERQKVLEEFEEILKTSVPGYEESVYIAGFFVYDLNKPSNKYISTLGSQTENCINFVDNHIYHFSPINLQLSQSHIAFLKGGKVRVFESVNCEYNNDRLEEAINYASEILKNNKDRDETLSRLRNYRRYGNYRTVDDYRVRCNYDQNIREYSDDLIHRGKVLGEFADVLRHSVSEKVKKHFSWWYSVEESRGSGFFVWDLTEPLNKQTSLLERVEFKNEHVYHFAFIDTPFSFSNIAVLENGKPKFFKAINCKGKGESLEDVVAYLKEKLKNNKNKKEIISRVKNYREYGVYASFNGLSTPQCEELVETEK